MEIVAHYANPREHVRPVADERGALDGLGYLSIFDQVGFECGKDELPLRLRALVISEIVCGRWRGSSLG